MIEKILKTTYGRLKIKIPTALAEITLGQIMEIQETHSSMTLRRSVFYLASLYGN